MAQKEIKATFLRFDLCDQNVIHIKGTWKEGLECHFFLDKHEIKDFEIEIKNNGLTELSVKLPENYQSYKRLSVTYVENYKSNIWYTCLIKDMVEMNSTPQFFVDKVSLDLLERKCQVQGWAVSRNEISYQVKDEHGAIIPHAFESTSRNDIQDEYSEYDIGRKCGFEIEFPIGTTSAVNLILSSEGSSVSYFIPLSKLRILSNKIKNACGRMWFNLRTEGVFTMLSKIVKSAFSREDKDENDYTQFDYSDWLTYHQITLEELDREKQEQFPVRPLLSIVIPLYKTPKKYLKELIRSIQKQSYSNWELCLSDGSGPDSPLKRFLAKMAKKDNRIKVYYDGRQMQISENTNAAISVSTGDYIVFADHDDVLAPNALYECAKAINEHPDVEFIYSDEDKITMDGKSYFLPHFKPDFNLDLLLSMNYFCHLSVVKRTLMNKAGLLNSEFDGSQDFDFVLRCVENTKPDHIFHIAKILYHWRAHKDSTAENPESKKYAFDAGRRAVQAYFDRHGINAKVTDGAFPGLYMTEYMIERQPLISIIIPNKDHIDDLKRCVNSLLKVSDYKNIEILIVENNSTEQETFEYYEKIQKEHSEIRVLKWNDDFNYSKINNFGVAHAKGEYLLFLNNDTEIINSDCIRQMLGYCQRNDVGAVGARLFYPDDTIQHAGVIVGLGGVAGHAFAHFPAESPGYFGYIFSARDYSAVTAACMLVKKSVFDQVNGFNEDLAVAFNDVDFCLKIRKAGYLIVYNPSAKLYHFESKSRGLDDTPEKRKRFIGEIETFESLWKDFLRKGDPCYNPNQTLGYNDFSLRRPNE